MMSRALHERKPLGRLDVLLGRDERCLVYP